MRAAYYEKQELEHILAVLMPANRLALEVSLATGLRIGDVLALRTAQLKPRFTVKEQKTGKTRSVYLPADLLRRAIAQAGRYYVFEGRTTNKCSRTRQAVFKDLARACKLLRLRTHISPHTARKTFAVEAYRASGGNLKRVQLLLNHSSEAVTMLYAMSDELCKRTRQRPTRQ